LYDNLSTIKRTLYLKPRFRRPVQLARPLGLVDLQALPPPAWCEYCGSEAWEGVLCRRCQPLDNDSIPYV